MLSVSKIYDKYVKGKNISLKDWIKVEQVLYNAKERKSTFKVWLNRKYTLMQDKWMNFNWEQAQDFVKNNEDSIKTVVGTLESNLRKEKSGEPVEKEIDEGDGTATDRKDRFLGLPRGVTITVGALLVLGIGFGIFKIVKSVKNKKK